MKIKNILLITMIFVILLSISSISASDNNTDIIKNHESEMLSANDFTDTLELNDENDKLCDSSTDLKNKIITAKNGAEITLTPGTYKVHNIELTRNITLQGNGNPEDIIIDGEKSSSIFLIRSPNVHVTFKNITFINGLTDNFGGAISMETGNVYVDNCIFINNTALEDTNAGAISNYGTNEHRGYLFVNNSLFINNHADHDGGAITTCYANSDIYNCVFINNSAHRDGGAIRVSIFGYGNVQDCIFMFNHADEWGGAYYSWSGESNIERCIFMNNTAGTNGGAVMVSGNINIEKSIIVNNDGGETGGSFYIQQPMYDTKTVINVHDNIITNNTSPYGKEIFILWKDSYNLYPQFDDNDWGDEDPNDSSVNDPNNVTQRSKVSNTIKSNLFNELTIDLLYLYKDILKSYFPDDSLDELRKQFPNTKTYDENNEKIADEKTNTQKTNPLVKNEPNDQKKTTTNPNATTDTLNMNTDSPSQKIIASSENKLVYGNSTSHGKMDKAYELNETGGSVAKQANSDIKYFIVLVAIALILLAIGYKRDKKLE